MPLQLVATNVSAPNNNESEPSTPETTPTAATNVAHGTLQDHQQQIPPRNIPTDISSGDAFFVRSTARTTRMSQEKLMEKDYLSFVREHENAQASGSNVDKSSNDTTADKPTTLDASDNAGVLYVDSGDDDDASEGGRSQSSDDSSDSETGRECKRRKKSPSFRKPQPVVQPKRSPSLTPPPALPETKLSEFRAELVRQLTSLTDFGQETTSVAFSVPSITPLNPQLESLAERLKRSEPSEDPLRESEANKVTVKVQGVGDPRVVHTNEQSKAIDAEFQKPMKFVVHTNDNFEQIYFHFSKRKNLHPRELVFTYQDVQVFSSSTPASLNMTGKVTIEACTRSTFAYLERCKEEEKQRKLAEMARQIEALAQEATSTNSQVEFDNDDSDGAMKLSLQCKDRKVVKLLVKPTTLIASIIETFCKKRTDIPPGAKIRLEFEGEALDPATRLEDTDIEDGDMLSVFVG